MFWYDQTRGILADNIFCALKSEGGLSRTEIDLSDMKV